MEDRWTMESAEEPDARPSAEPNPEPETAAADGQPDSVNFERCSTCAHADGIDRNAGTLHCKQHDMHVNAEADEIPDDCVEYETKCKTDN